MLRKRFRRYIACILLCVFVLLPFQTVSAAGSAVNEIDLGDYQSEMKAGEKQLLDVTLLPDDTADQTITYSSSNTGVATINGMGRITAVKAGVTEIRVSCGNVTEKFKLTVTDTETVRDLDLGDCPSEIEVGTSHILDVTVIPEAASSENILYQTSNAGIATVNEIGRVTGVREGEVTITVTCGSVRKKLSLSIVGAKDGTTAVTDIEIADHEDELEVDKTMTLTATVIPSDATDSTLTYRSSDENIATVNSSGEVKGIAKGDVTITISAGAVTKRVNLKVKVATKKIELDTTYLVLALGDSHQLLARVMPEEADQSVTFESGKPEIASVSSTGVVTAKKCGTGEIIVRNGDTSTAVTVIVNQISDKKQEIKKSISQIAEEYENEVDAKDYPVITADMLKFFYKEDEELTVYGDGYTIKIEGSRIENWENEFYTDLDLKEEESGVSFELNRGEKLCGPVSIQFDENMLSGNYVYLYNTSKEKYELIKEKDVTSLRLDTAGKYLITESKLPYGKVYLMVLAAAGIVVIILLVIYVVVKKPYWFW